MQKSGKFMSAVSIAGLLKKLTVDKNDGVNLYLTWIMLSLLPLISLNR